MEAQPRTIRPVIALLRWTVPALMAIAGPAMLARAQAPTPPPLMPTCSVPPSPGTDPWPVAITDAIGSTTGAPIVFSSVSLLANDVGGPALTVTAPVNAVSSAGGTITGADPFTYTPPASAFTGTDRFTYELADGAGRKAIGIVRVAVNVAAPPVLVPAPDVTGASEAAAIDALAAVGLTSAITRSNSTSIAIGVVISQSPTGSTPVAAGSAVNLVVSLGPAVVVTNVVPDVVAQTRAAALTAITGVGLTGGAMTFANHTTLPAGSIVSTSPLAGTPLAPGSAVAMVVSLGTEGLVLAYGFDEVTGLVATDSSVVGSDGTIRGALRVAGKFGRALSFNGVNDWVTLADMAASPIDLTDGMTLEAWVNPTELTDWDTIILKERGAGALSYGLYANDGSPQPGGVNAPAGYQRMANGAADVAVRGSALPLDAWTHLAMTYDGTMERLFVNGVQVASRALTGNIAVADGALRIGGNTAYANEFYKGVIDEVRIYNRARTAEQITGDMTTPIVRVPDAGTDPPVLVPAPDVTGASEVAATGALGAVGLTSAITRSNSTSIGIGLVISQTPAGGTPLATGSAVNLLVSLGAQVPNLVLSPRANASGTLATAGLTIGTVTEVNHATVPAGSVISQTPLAGTNAQPGSAVTLVASLGPAAVVTNVVPDVVAQTRAAALTAITGAGLTGGTVTFANHATMPAGAVVSTSPVAGTALAPGSAVAMVVSLGTEGLVVAYGFDEATGLVATDSSVVGRNGTIRGALHVDGKFGRALSFNGVNDWVTLADTAASPIDLTNGLTLEAWVKPTELTDWDTIILKERGTGGLSYGLYANDGAPQPGGFNGPAGYQRMANGATDVAVRGPALPLDAWTHLAMTYDGATEKLFVNGVQVASRAQTGNIAVANGALRIGGNTAFANEFYKGLIDEVRIYNRARTAEQITTDMNTPIVR